MKIAVNTRLLLRGKLDGIGWFTHEIVSRIVKAHPEHEFHFLFDRPYDKAFIFSSNVHAHVVSPQAKHPLLFRIWYNWMIPRKLKQIGADIFISLDTMASLRTNCKQIVVIHDLNFEHYPEDLPGHISRYFRSQTPLVADKVDSIITVSEFSKTDIIEQYGVQPTKIHVVCNAAQSSYRVLNEHERQEVRDEWTEGAPYFIFISSIHPRKNLQRLLLAYDQFRRESGQDVKLLAVGRRFWKNESLDSTLKEMQFGNDVIFTGHLEQAALCRALGAALSVVYVSYFEGFGVPIVEAFQSGVPVITSNVTSMPEVAGGAAMLVDPFDANDIARAMLSVFQDEETRTNLVEKGLERAQQFSWEQSAIDLWNVVEHTTRM